MPLNVTTKSSSVNSNTPSRVITRQEVKMGQPSPSSARVTALKNRLSGKEPTQPVAPRPAGSTARREEMSKLNKFTTQSKITTQPAQPGKTSARQEDVDFNKIAPPPSGLASGHEAAPSPNTVETPEKAPEANSEPLSPQYVALARKERQLRKAQQEFKAAQDAWKQDQANYIPKNRLTSETLKVLAEAGITPDKLVELQINQASSQDPNQALIDKIGNLEKQLKDLTDPENGTLAQRDKQAYEGVVSQIGKDVQLLVDSDPRFGTIKSEGNTKDVVDLITGVFEQEDIILDVEEAAQLVEDKLVSKLIQQYERISKYEKIKAKLGKAAEQPEANNEQQPQSNRPLINTLTNAGASQRPLSARDKAVLKVQERLDALKGR
jgi:hypothetical protein